MPATAPKHRSSSGALRANAPAALFDDGFVKLAGAQVAATEPSLGTRFAQGWLLPHEGQLDNRQVLSALAAGLSARGVETHWHTAIDAMPDARIVIDCRGLGAKPAWPALRGIRGEVARVHAPGIGLTRPVRLLHPRYPLYIAPKQDDLYVIGATEVEGEDMSPVSVRSALELLSAAFSVHPGFGEARILELNAALPPDAARSPAGHRLGRARTLRVNGLYRHGFMIAPEVADSAAQLAEGCSRRAVSGTDSFDDFRLRTRWPEMLHCEHAVPALATMKDSHAMNIHINQRPFDLPDAAHRHRCARRVRRETAVRRRAERPVRGARRTCVEGAAVRATSSMSCAPVAGG